ncbi:RTX-I toxin determinant A from serotypes 1/9 [Pseudoruegeria aquimaris]|uniref:RTX-I toxin determinant A from serotypes 1/9 n=1 Tax=Pseudoruegeria aquimaris TaxID=393663 RepID=A0A1Y5RQG5_9RHOB|nr:calcium-binding protein [Pseudoruegeria aquimaris]SLN21911.1 RTX-I toxin determinant A from serotypes 1/9 [Pseudoruegeria aquimaris]
MAAEDQNTQAQNMAEQTGTAGDDTLVGGAGQDSLDGGAGNDDLSGQESEDRLLGGQGDDSLDGGDGNDLAAGDYVGSEWELVDGVWVYHPDRVISNPDWNTLDPFDTNYNDTITTGAGEDVLLGNRGNDRLDAGAGDDLINAGSGVDTAYGREGDDVLNLESGNDTGYGGAGADIVNAGDGDDLVYGDSGAVNLIADAITGSKPQTFEQHAQQGGWALRDGAAGQEMVRSIETNAGETYELSFDLAANLSAGATSGTVEILWNGAVVDTVSTTSGAYQTHSVQVEGTGGPGELSFRIVQDPAEAGPEIDMSGPIYSYDKTMQFGGQEVSVEAFAPGQAKLYQVIDGQLKVFDPATETYADAGPPTGIKINATGFNVEDDLIYGVARSTGVDALGRTTSPPDLVALDAKGNFYRVGEAPFSDYVGDFDSSGNLWSFNSSLNRVAKIDVDSLDADGNPEVTVYDLPNDLLKGQIFDIAYSAKDDCFYAVQAPSRNGGNGELHRIDLSEVGSGGEPQITTIPIAGTLFGDTMQSGMVKGAYGAVFLDGDGNLFFGLNKGDHDLDASTGAEGGVYQVHYDFNTGYAYNEFKSTAQTTNSNDGAVDPRSVDPFAEVDTESPILLKDPSVVSLAGGNDDLRGGDGDDVMFGEAGDDKLHGGSGDDELSGGEGNDKILGGTGNDSLDGGSGDDKLMSGGGHDTVEGGAGNDYIHAGGGDDVIDGGAGADKIVGGAGSDVISGGAGNDHLWGGNWAADGSSDTFVVARGGGSDMVHDFESGHDVVDLSDYGLSYEQLQGLMEDQGWATVIDLSSIEGGPPGDKLILKSVSIDDLDESNFIL